MMPPKSKRKLQLKESLQAARAAKLSRKSGEGTFSAVRTDDVSDISLYQLIAMHDDDLDTDDETLDPSFDLDSSARSVSDHLVHKKSLSPTEILLSASINLSVMLEYITLLLKKGDTFQRRQPENVYFIALALNHKSTMLEMLCSFNESFQMIPILLKLY